MSHFDYNENITAVAEAIRKNITGFGEILTTEYSTVIDLKSVYGVSEFRDNVTTTNSGTVTNSAGAYELSTGATSNSEARLESVEYGRYVAGFEATPGMGVRVPSIPTGNEVGRWGYFDANDGFGVGVDSNGMFTFIRRGGVERTHRRSEWAFDLDVSLFRLQDVHIYRFPFRWYGSGPVRFYTTVTKAGDFPQLTPFDTFEAEDGKPILENPNLRLRAEVENNGTASDFKMYVYGRQFFVSGGYSPSRRFSSEYRIETSVGTTFVPLVSFREKSSFASISAKIANVSLAVSSENVIWQLRWNPSLTGANFTAPNNLSANETALEFDNEATALSDGDKLDEGVAAAGQGASSAGSDIEVPDLEVPVLEPITLCARSASGTATVTSVLKAREEW